ncbi:TetR/AcrR family transcriptional regulator [Brachybacterium phenoliresistens]|uniref:HTH tetR-type domain-containing protein n=1 Tax=Brachybacterium phenoliresistens TaxID=396014 RepID=Z9JR39_9MICO|nr:TetR/AcrR family transcriptional regulator [Brachybacterium phenoliresistens]EWS80483.1 hypothetical protein BF93_03550 [Brachybacterium phenoliresistens]
MPSPSSSDPKPEKTRAADPRPARTRQAVMDAMVRLAAEGRDDITVFSLAKEAGISRAAFYTHFSDLEDVAKMLIVPVLDSLAEEDAADAAADLPAPDRARRSILRVLDALVDHGDLVRVVSRWKVSAAVDGVIVRALADRFEVVLEASPVDPPGCTVRDRAVFLGGGIFVTLSAWLIAEEPLPRETVRARARSLVEHLLERAAAEA